MDDLFRQAYLDYQNGEKEIKQFRPPRLQWIWMLFLFFALMMLVFLFSRLTYLQSVNGMINNHYILSMPQDNISKIQVVEVQLIDANLILSEELEFQMWHRCKELHCLAIDAKLLRKDLEGNDKFSLPMAVSIIMKRRYFQLDFGF